VLSLVDRRSTFVTSVLRQLRDNPRRKCFEVIRIARRYDGAVDHHLRIFPFRLRESINDSHTSLTKNDPSRWKIEKLEICLLILVFREWLLEYCYEYL
jgi:hypothetical protein